MTSVSQRLIPLRRVDKCHACGVDQPPGTRAWWDGAAKAVTCTACHDTSDPKSSDFGPAREPDVSSLGDPPPSGTPEGVAHRADTRLPVAAGSGPAGGSADRKHQRLRDRREQRVRAAHPRIGGLLLALFDDPQTTTAWAVGAEGERHVGARLDATQGAGIVVLHDRRIPGRPANIDHLAVGPAGVYVIDTKRHRGLVAAKDMGGWRRSDVRLFVGKRDRTKLVEGIAHQVATVTGVLSRLPVGMDVEVIPVLCFDGAEWGWFAKPFSMGGVHVCSPKTIAQLVRRPGPLDAERIADLADHLATSLPPA
jgi:hypothetical protein